MRWQTICFDLDNTLYSHEQAFEKAIKHCYSSIYPLYEATIDTDIWFRVFKHHCDLYWSSYEQGALSRPEYQRKRFSETMKYFTLSYSDKESDVFHQQYFDIIDDFVTPFEGVKSLLHTLQRTGVTLGIISNGNAVVQHEKVRKLGLTSLFNGIFISEDIGVEKPDARIFSFALDKLQQIIAGGVLFVGDAWIHDIVGALEAGWDAIYLNTRNENPTTNHIPYRQCETFSQLATIIREDTRLKG
ncbi:HAD family hydrolase [Bacillus alkalicellulosilyticus]|uniref:HAD family hydrolase n=1 Tax=Alkalihalobacterium alkalicellulosilyticum TaxID=1912214 RepID=UPI000998BCEB|nr:HAD-IA family hydrolase [Bacillus alkalicellulosilyticus]